MNLETLAQKKSLLNGSHNHVMQNHKSSATEAAPVSKALLLKI